MPEVVSSYIENKDLLEVRKIQKTLLDEFRLPCSIGIAPNKFLAKMASDMKKPLGITILRKREVEQKLWPLPINNMMGVGKKTAPRLESIGIKTIGDVAKFKNIELLKKTVGPAMTEYLINKSYGIDDSKVIYDSFEDVSSVSNSSTFDFDEYDIKTIKGDIEFKNVTFGYGEIPVLKDISFKITLP